MNDPSLKDVDFLVHWRRLGQYVLRYLCSGISLHKTLHSLFLRDVDFILLSKYKHPEYEQLSGFMLNFSMPIPS